MIPEYDFTNKINHDEVGRLMYALTVSCPRVYQDSWLNLNKLEMLLNECYETNLTCTDYDTDYSTTKIISLVSQTQDSKKRIRAWEGNRVRTGLLYMFFNGRKIHLCPEEEDTVERLNGPSVAFFEELEIQIELVNTHFLKWLEKCRSFVQRGLLSKVRRSIQKIARKTGMDLGDISPEDEVFWCRKCAQVNAAAVASLLERYTLQMRSPPGTPRAVHSTSNLLLSQISKEESFMSRPVWVELRAIQEQVSMLYGMPARTEQSLRSSSSSPTACLSPEIRSPVLCFLGEGGGGGGSPGMEDSLEYCSTSMMVDGMPTLNLPPLRQRFTPRFEEYDLQCAICLDVMYEPVGLHCGHCFCTECLVNICGQTPQGKGLNPQQETPTCPLCREGYSMDKVMHLPELGHLIKMRYPKDWKQKQREAIRREILQHARSNKRVKHAPVS